MSRARGHPVLHRFGDMVYLGGTRLRKVGNGARNFQNTVGRAGRPPQPCCGHIEKLQSGVIELQVLIDLFALQGMVGFPLTLKGALARCTAAGTDTRGTFAWSVKEQFSAGHGGYVNM